MLHLHDLKSSFYITISSKRKVETHSFIGCEQRVIIIVPHGSLQQQEKLSLYYIRLTRGTILRRSSMRAQYEALP